MHKENPYLAGDEFNCVIALFEQARRARGRVVYASSSSPYKGRLAPNCEEATIQAAGCCTEVWLAMEGIAELYGVSSPCTKSFSEYQLKGAAKKRRVNMVASQRQDGKTPIIYGLQTWNFNYIKDTLQALQPAMKSNYYDILNLCIEKACSFNQVIELLKKTLVMPIKPKYIEKSIKIYVRNTLSYTSKSEEVLGFRLKYNLDESIKRSAQVLCKMRLWSL
ncbi:Uncharacterised protein [uncultured archaeon]|nr:Uncharacterised protein [uncultured archaeon]